MRKRATGWDTVMARIDAVYGDGLIERVNALERKEASEKEVAAVGDGLAVFIVREAGDVSMGCKNLSETAGEIAHAMRRAIMELEAVAEELESI